MLIEFHNRFSLAGAGKCRHACVLALWLLAMWMPDAAVGDMSPAVAGLQPDRRPLAPTVTVIARSNEWYARAFSGVELPYPWTLQFLNQQGNWHTPFTEPGMTGPYDIRGWHRHGAVSGGEEKTRR